MVQETWVSGENHRPVSSHWQTLSHNVVSSKPCHELDSNVIICACMFTLYQIWTSSIKKLKTNSPTQKCGKFIQKIAFEKLEKKGEVCCENRYDICMLIS